MFPTGVPSLGRPQILEDLTAPDEDVFGAAWAADRRFGSGASLRRLHELEEARRGRPRGAFSMPGEGRFGLDETLYEPTSPMVSAEEARERIGSLNITIPDEGIREAHLELLIEARRDEVARQSILARRDLSWLGEAALIGQSVIASALDPLDVASAFVPIIREARFARWASRFGVVRARAARGAIEGVAGAALVEPIVLAAATAEQSDYGAWDSLMNIALGGVLGGGLHVTGGAALDRIRRARGRPTTIEMINRSEFLEPVAGRSVAAFREAGDTFADISRRLDAMPFQQREALMRVAVGQVMSGQSVDVVPMLRNTPQFADVLAPGAQAVDRPVIAQLLPDGRVVRPPDTSAGVQARRVTDTPSTDQPAAVRLRRITDQEAPALDVVREDGAPRLFGSAEEAQQAADAEGLSDVDPVPVSTPEGARIALARNADPELGRAAQVSDAVRAPETSVAGRPVIDEAGDVVPQEHLTSPPPVLDDTVIERLRHPERFDLFGTEPADAQRLIDEAGDDAVDISGDLEEALAQIEALRARGALTAEGEAALQAAQDAVEEGRRRAETIRAAAHCLAA